MDTLGVANTLVLLYCDEIAGVADPDTDLEDEAGVTLPLVVVEVSDALPYGVIRPVDAEGVMRPENDGVTRPPWKDATDDGRELDTGFPAVGGESLVAATKTPHVGGQ